MRTLLMISYNCGLPLNERKPVDAAFENWLAHFGLRLHEYSSFTVKLPLAILWNCRLLFSRALKVLFWYQFVNSPTPLILSSPGDAVLALFLWKSFLSLWQPKLRGINDYNILLPNAYLTNRRHICEKKKSMALKNLGKSRAIYTQPS